MVRDFPRPDLGPNNDPAQFKNEPKLSKMVCIIPNFLPIHFGENFMKIPSKIPKLQMHENLHKDVNENMYSFICIHSHFYVVFMSFMVVHESNKYVTALHIKFLIIWFLIHLKWRSSSIFFSI